MEKSSRPADLRAVAFLLLVHLAVVAIVQPRGEFPLNDDWAYAHSVRWLLDEGRIRLSDWIAMNLLPQTLAGGVTAVFFGYSFEALRHLTQLTALLASGMGYLWFRANRLDPIDALVASLVLIAFPGWPAVANSYMTDLYGLLLALASATLFVRVLDRPSRGTLVAATAIAAMGVLQRQVVLVVPFAFMAAWSWRVMWDGERRHPAVIATGVAPFAIVLAAEWAYQLYLQHGPGLPEAQQYVHGRVLVGLRMALTNEDGHRGWVGTNLFTMTGCLGLCFVGWAAWWGVPGARRPTPSILIVAGASLAVALLAFDLLPPFQPDQFVDRPGVGPFTLFDAIPRWTAQLDRSPGILWRVAGVGAAFGAIALVALLAKTGIHLFRKGSETDPRDIFLAAFIIGYTGPFLVTAYIDRYLLFLLPFFVVLWARMWPRDNASLVPASRVGASLWILAAIAASAVSTHDYFVWNRARWDLIHAAERLGATPETLDGGFEYNGYKRFEHKPREIVPGKSWWWVKDDLYVITFSPRPGYDIVETRALQPWLSRSPAELHLSRRR